MKCCSTCLLNRPYTDYSPDRRRSDGCQSRCKECHSKQQRSLRKAHPKRYRKHDKANKLWSKYRLRLAEYDRMLEAQAGVCAICLRKETRPAAIAEMYDLSVDHCHSTGRVRGLLCRACNHALGSLEDDIPRLERAIAYLRRSGAAEG